MSSLSLVLITKARKHGSRIEVGRQQQIRPRRELEKEDGVLTTTVSIFVVKFLDLVINLSKLLLVQVRLELLWSKQLLHTTIISTSELVSLEDFQQDVEDLVLVILSHFD